MVKVFLVIGLSVALMGCATLSGRNRVVSGMGLGASLGAASGAALSPNAESRGINALVFGLSGALAGGLVSYLSDAPTTAEKRPDDLKTRELGSVQPGRDFLILPEASLPDFVRKRMRPVVVEEFTERDHLSEEGTLHEPHKAYRIKRPAELLISPSGEERASENADGIGK